MLIRQLTIKMTLFFQIYCHHCGKSESAPILMKSSTIDDKLHV